MSIGFDRFTAAYWHLSMLFIRCSSACMPTDWGSCFRLQLFLPPMDCHNMLWLWVCVLYLSLCFFFNEIYCRGSWYTFKNLDIYFSFYTLQYHPIYPHSTTGVFFSNKKKWTWRLLWHFFYKKKKIKCKLKGINICI